MTKEELVKGKTYWVNINDCCVEGSFKGKFVGFMVLVDDNNYKSYDTWPEEYEFGQVHFDTGYVDGWAYDFTEIPNG